MAGRIGADDLGLDPDSGERDLFRWFLASLLFSARISQDVARRTFEVFREHGVDDPRSIVATGWQGLVDLLGEGHYVRYDESTATYLLESSRLLLDRYDGRITEVLERSSDKGDLQRRLQEFKGVGPKGVEIFLRHVDEQRHLGKKAEHGDGAANAEDLMTLTRDELYERARRVNVHGRSHMSKKELAEELSRAA